MLLWESEKERESERAVGLEGTAVAVVSPIRLDGGGVDGCCKMRDLDLREGDTKDEARRR